MAFNMDFFRKEFLSRETFCKKERGFQGIGSILPRQKPVGQGLADADIEVNRKLSYGRIIVENSTGAKRRCQGAGQALIATDASWTPARTVERPGVVCEGLSECRGTTRSPRNDGPPQPGQTRNVSQTTFSRERTVTFLEK
jgi:hypothetical protein